MTDSYFSKMGLINYENYTCRNITQRVALIHSQKRNADNYAPINVGSTRADIVAYNVYNDSYLDWEIWLDNKILDPYYGWSLNQQDFQNYIIDKYGSVPWASQAISHYRLNWPSEDIQVSASYYEYTLPPQLRRYYSPVWGQGGMIIGYTRSLENWVMNTNQIVQFSLQMTNPGTSFQSNDVIQLVSSSQIVGQCTSVMANSTVLVAQHVVANNGSPTAPIGLQSFLTGETAVAANVTTLQTNIGIDEAVYWEPVTYYEIEEEENAKKQFVEMTDAGLVMQISSGITKLLANN